MARAGTLRCVERDQCLRRVAMGGQRKQCPRRHIEAGIEAGQNRREHDDVHTQSHAGNADLGQRRDKGRMPGLMVVQFTATMTRKIDRT